MPKDDFACAPIEPPGLVADTVRRFGVVKKSQKLKTARAILRAHAVGTVLRGDEHAFAALLLDGHPRAAAKKGNGVKGFVVTRDSEWRNFSVVRTDGTRAMFSMHTSLKSKVQDARANAKQAFRTEIRDQIAAFRASLAEDKCAECGTTSAKEYHVDHATTFDFNVLVDRFRHTVIGGALPEAYKPPGASGKDADYRFADTDTAAQWADFHHRNAKLQLLCATCNLTKKANPTELFCD